MEPRDFTIDTIQVGDTASFTHVFTEEDIVSFAAISGDKNPLHLDKEYAATTKFSSPIVHGMLTASLFSQLVGMYLPGKRCLYLQQTLTFKNPLYVGEEVVVSGLVIAKSIATKIVTLTLTAQKQDIVIVEGEAKVQLL